MSAFCSSASFIYDLGRVVYFPLLFCATIAESSSIHGVDESLRATYKCKVHFVRSTG